MDVREQLEAMRQKNHDLRNRLFAATLQGQRIGRELRATRAAFREERAALRVTVAQVKAAARGVCWEVGGDGAASGRG